MEPTIRVIGIAALAIALIGTSHGLALADDASREACVGIATSQPHVEKAEISVQGIYKGTYSYFDNEFIEGKVDPLPAECQQRYGRRLTCKLEIQSATNNAVWMRRPASSSLAVQPSPEPKDLFGSDEFSQSSTTEGISDLYAAHYLNCRKRHSCTYHPTLQQLRQQAWDAVSKYQLYVCSQRSVRPPFLRARRSSPGRTKARITFFAAAFDLKAHLKLTERTYTKPLSVKGAC